MEGDEARRGIWLVDVPLAATHHLRHAINTGKAVSREVFERYEIPIVASALKLYLLELPGTYSIPFSTSQRPWLTVISDSLVSCQVYEIIRTIYSTPDSSTSTQARISVLQNTLGQLRLANIATLDALTTHFTRLIELTSADEPYISALANNLAPCILRPKTDTSLTMHERHSYRLVRDLFAHKEEIFGELKRASALSHTPSGGAASKASRVRAISTDESNRRANTEARNRAIASKSRNSSPAPPANGRTHRRDRSSDPPTSRFPIHTNSPAAGEAPVRRGAARTSLEVPGDEGPTSQGERPVKPNNISHMINNLNNSSRPLSEKSSHLSDSNYDAHNNAVGEANGTTTFAEERESLGRSSRFPPRKQGTSGSLGGRAGQGDGSGIDSTNKHDLDPERAAENGERQGVQLSDKPMDD